MTETLCINIGLTAESPKVVRGATFPTGGDPKAGGGADIEKFAERSVSIRFQPFFAQRCRIRQERAGGTQGAEFLGRGSNAMASP